MPGNDGSDFPDSILLMYPGFCPIDKLISRADTPFFSLSCASLNAKSFSSNTPSPSFYNILTHTSCKNICCEAVIVLQ